MFLSAGFAQGWPGSEVVLVNARTPALAAALLAAGMGPAVLATVLATGAAIAGAVIGVYLRGLGNSTRMMVPFGGGLLLGVSVFGLFPELVGELGVAGGVVLFSAGYLTLLAVNRYIYPVCPSCAPEHNHDVCRVALHGFAGPLVAAAAIHSALDGWSIVTAEWAAPLGVRMALPVAVALHKVPEGIALGAILRAAVISRPAALGWCVLAEMTTLAGGALALAIAPRLGGGWVSYPLAIAGGFFVYLGFHAVHGEWKRRGALPAFMPALTGAAGAAAIQQGARALMR